MFWKTARQRKILEATYAECPNCSTTDHISAWNQLAKDTYGDQAPDIRQSATSKKNSFPYQCPRCFKGYSANKIFFLTDEEVQESLKTS